MERFSESSIILSHISFKINCTAIKWTVIGIGAKPYQKKVYSNIHSFHFWTMTMVNSHSRSRTRVQISVRPKKSFWEGVRFGRMRECHHFVILFRSYTSSNVQTDGILMFGIHCHSLESCEFQILDTKQSNNLLRSTLLLIPDPQKSKVWRSGGWMNGADGKCFNSWNQIRWFSELLSAKIPLRHKWLILDQSRRENDLKKVKN